MSWVTLKIDYGELLTERCWSDDRRHTGDDDDVDDDEHDCRRMK